MSLPELKNSVITLAIKFNYADLLSDLDYLSEAQLFAVYLMLTRLQGG